MFGFVSKQAKHGLDTVIVLWTANTERFTDVEAGLNMTAEEILNSIAQNKDEVWLG
jgi:myo-inositol-1-phosphate synthase